MENIWDKQDFFIGEEDYATKIEQDLRIFREKNYQDGFFTAKDGVRIHYTYVKNPKEKAAIAISHGFCEFIHKFEEAIYYFYEIGYSVYYVDHRGHGFSERMTEEIDKVSVKSFDDYVSDFKQFMDEVVLKQSPNGPYFLFSHSMGGNVAAQFLEQYPEYFQAAVLSSPMMSINYGKVPRWAVKALVLWSTIAHWGNKYAPGQNGYDPTYAFETSSGQSKTRYDYLFHLRQKEVHYRTYGGTYAWSKAAVSATKKVIKYADRVQIPVLLAQAGQDSLVLPEAHEVFAEKSKNTRIIRFPSSKHEIYNAPTEVRCDYYKQIFQFFEDQLSARNTMKR